MALTRPRAYQIYDIDYKQAVRVVTISNITLSGGAPNAVDGVSLSLNDRVLVTGQTNPAQNGIYYVTTLGSGSNGTWSRSIDTDTTGELLAGTIVMVTEGLTYADTQWKLTTDDPITIGVTALTFIQNFQGPILVNGTSNIQIPTANSNVVMSVDGTPNVVVYASTGEYVTGLVSVTGNAYVGNVLANGYYWANGVVFGGGGGGTPGGANTQVQFNDNGAFNGTAGFTFNKASNAIVATGNITSGNLLTTGLVSATGNISGAYLLGNAYFVTGLSPTRIYNGTSEINIGTSGGNANVSIGGTSNVAVFSTTGVFQRGSYVATWTTSNTTPTNSVQGDQWYVPSSDKRYLYVNDGTSNTWVDQSQTTSFSTLAVTGAATIGSTLGVTGNITGGNLTTTTITFSSAINSGANGTGNIGTSTGYFNTVFAKATSAQYADIAEKYSSDYPYEPGTVVSFGGDEEVTIAVQANDNSVAGVVSTNPAYIMNAGIQAKHIVEVALTGRVPTKVIGPVRKGNMMVSAGNGYAQACATPNIGTVIGKAIENFDGSQGIIEIVVGRM